MAMSSMNARSVFGSQPWIQKGDSDVRTLHHVGLLTCFCLMSGIPWISHYDLLLFATAPLLYMSFQSMKCLESLDRWAG